MTDSPLIRTIIKTPDGVTDSIAIPPNPPVWTYTDVDGDKAALFTASIPDVGPGIYLRTSDQGCSVAAADAEEFIGAIRNALPAAQRNQDAATTAASAPKPLADMESTVSFDRLTDLLARIGTGDADFTDMRAEFRRVAGAVNTLRYYLAEVRSYIHHLERAYSDGDIEAMRSEIPPAELRDYLARGARRPRAEASADTTEPGAMTVASAGESITAVAQGINATATVLPSGFFDELLEGEAKPVPQLVRLFRRHGAGTVAAHDQAAHTGAQRADDEFPAAGPGNPVITLCGSMRFYERMLQVAAKLTSRGWIVLMPHDASLTGIPDKTAIEHGRMLDEMHRAKIRMGSAVYIVNTGAYIGESTRGEIAYAGELGIQVEYDEPAETAA